MACRCDEAKLIGSPYRTVKGILEPLQPQHGWERAHDCGYVRRRNALIPAAERVANAAAATGANWARAFFTAMEELASGLRAS